MSNEQETKTLLDRSGVAKNAGDAGEERTFYDRWKCDGCVWPCYLEISLGRRQPPGSSEAYFGRKCVAAGITDVSVVNWRLIGSEIVPDHGRMTTKTAC